MYLIEPGILETQNASKTLHFFKSPKVAYIPILPFVFLTTSTQDISSITFQSAVMLKLNCPKGLTASYFLWKQSKSSYIFKGPFLIY